MILGQTVHVGVVGEELVYVALIRIVVIGVCEVLIPVTGVVITRFEPALLGRFPLIIRLDLYALVRIVGPLVLV